MRTNFQRFPRQIVAEYGASQEYTKHFEKIPHSPMASTNNGHCIHYSYQMDLYRKSIRLNIVKYFFQYRYVNWPIKPIFMRIVAHKYYLSSLKTKI